MTKPETKDGAGAPCRWPAALLALPLLGLLTASSGSGAAPREARFDDPLFRRCLNWMLDGTGGALIDNLCLEHYSLPPPSLFQCARKVTTGFSSANDQEGCAVLFEEEARKVRAGYIK
jgi:hypothetical protein